MPELLFEIGCEEIPAHDLFALPDALKQLAGTEFEQQRLVYSGLEVEATPRRIVLRAEFEPQQKDLREQRMGPPKRVAIDANGHPTPAGLGFAKNAGMTFEKLQIVTTPKGDYLAAEIVMKGRATAAVLRDLLPQMVSRLPFHKYMRWQNGNFIFGRPIRNLVCLFGGKVIPLEIAGVKAGKFTFGHRFLGKKKLPVGTYEEYKSTLQENGVLLRFSERMDIIARQLAEHATVSGGELKDDHELMRIMANEVEFPEVLSGNFPNSFLDLPHEILINAMRKHQKYFCSVGPNGSLLPVFHTVLNTKAMNPELIRTGHERVLLARLRDAEFFWQEDRKTSLEDRKPALDRLTYHEKLGNYTEKIGRMRSIASKILEQLKDADIDRTLPKLIDLSKVDLATLMVGEFPELQGIMGGLYARAEGHPESFWQALYDQYLPATTEDRVPRNLLGALLSLTDRFEILASGFVLNMIPTGSKDPYALRRVSTGAMKILLECQLPLNLPDIVQHSVSLYTWKSKATPGELQRGILDLFESRFRFLMEQRGIAHDYLNAILNTENRSYVDAQAKVQALWNVRSSDDLKILARGFKRINNIISDQPHLVFDAERLQEDGEIRLHRAFTDLAFRVKQNIQEKQYEDALEIMVTLGPEIDNFFDEVMVMVEQPDVRENRIALLQEISDLYRKLADFSALQIEL